jgi:predicted MPP superfamily phosphohydrolase
MQFVYWGISFIGHVGLWCATFNFLHSTALVRWARKSSEILVLLFLVFPVFFAMWQLISWIGGGDSTFTLIGSNVAGRAYSVVTSLIAIPTVLLWMSRKLSPKRPAAVIEFSESRKRIESHDGSNLLHGNLAQLLGKLPINETLNLSVDRLTVQLNVPQSLDGLKIAHLSDFHLTGYVDRRFFEQVVARANSFEPDLVIISGDLVDKPECLEWIDSIFGALKSKHGCYFVLGNHDLRVGDVDDLCQRLKAAGLIHVGGVWRTLEINGVTVQIAGNELPWFLGAEYLPLSANSSAQQTTTTPEPHASMKILISHSPDQLKWARPFEFDLMFAGHNHGGQISFPVVGPIIAPSRYGLRYAAGTFQIGKMLMHVSRGVSAEKPIRWNSMPELGLFTIRAAKD